MAHFLNNVVFKWAIGSLNSFIFVFSIPMLTVINSYNKICLKRGAAIAQWIRLHLPSCRPGFDSQACHQRFFQL